MRRLAFVLTLALAAPLWAADPPVARLSGPKAVEVGAPIILNPTGSVAPGGLEFGIARGPGPAPVVTLKSDDGQTVIGFGTAAAAGTYEFYVVAWGENVPNGRPIHSFAFWTVDIGTVTPPEPPPGPPPDTVDAALLSGLQAAYTADAGADKAASLAFLKAAYKGMATNPRAGLATPSAALAWMQSVVEAPGVGLTQTQLFGVRKAIAERLSADLGPSTAAVGLDAAKFKAELTTISNALQRVR